jgi:hypothetical protein
MGPCMCGATDCYSCHPENFKLNDFGRLVYIEDEDIEKDSEDEDISDEE